MAHLINKDAIVAEIERQKSRLKPFEGIGSNTCGRIIKYFDELLSFIDTLEVKEISDEYDGFLGKELKMVDDEIERLEKLKVKELDLDTEIMKYQREIYDRDTTVRDVAKYFFELGLKAKGK